MRSGNKNILILGAAGGVASAFLKLLAQKNEIKNKLVLMDRNEPVGLNLEKAYPGLNCLFVKQELSLPAKEDEYVNFLKKYDVGLVVDLTDMDSIPVLEATNRAGVSYLNTAMNDVKLNTDDLVFYVLKNRKNITQASHIIGAGMNPGNVNIWVRYGAEKFGIPESIIHFEFDDSMTPDKWRPIITWSPGEFLTESVYNPGGFVLGKEKVKKALPNALENLVEMKDILSPVLELENYPSGFPIVHEENMSLAHYYNVPSEFIYSIHPKTMSYMKDVYKKKGTVKPEDLILGDNVSLPLEGRDFIGVILNYPDREVYYYNAVDNKSVIGFNATYYQVAVGVFAALLAWLEGLEKGIHFTHELYDTVMPRCIFENLVVEEKVFSKKGTVKKLISHIICRKQES